MFGTRRKVLIRLALDDEPLHRAIAAAQPVEQLQGLGGERWAPVAGLLRDTGRDWDRRTHRISALAHALPLAVVDAWAGRCPESQDALAVRGYAYAVRAGGAGRAAVRRANEACAAAAEADPSDPTPWIAMLTMFRAHRAPIARTRALWPAIGAQDPFNRLAHHEMLLYLSQRACGTSPFDMRDFADECAMTAPHGSPLAVLPLAARAEHYAHRLGAAGGDTTLELSGHWHGPTVTREIDYALDRWFHTSARPHAQAIADLNILAFALVMTRRVDEAGPVFRRIGRHMTMFPWDCAEDPIDRFLFWSRQALSSGRR